MVGSTWRLKSTKTRAIHLVLMNLPLATTVYSRNSETRNSVNSRIMKIEFRVLWSFHLIKTLEIAKNLAIVKKNGCHRFLRYCGSSLYLVRITHLFSSVQKEMVTPPPLANSHNYVSNPTTGSEARFKGTTWSSKYFVLVCNFLLFNAGDLFGRFLAGLSNRLFEGRWGRWVCLTLAIVRVIFIPLFLMCNALPSPDRALPITFDKARAFFRQFNATYFSSL